MYQDLRSKLAMYKNGQKKSAAPMKAKGPDVHELMDGTVVHGRHGSCFILEKRYPLDYVHGGNRLEDALDLSGSILGNLCSVRNSPCRDISSENHDLRIEHLLFLDTETTGLSGGAGTVAFLVGIGFFCDDAFIIRQYFMRDYDEELPMLVEFNKALEDYSGLITFNGKSFDWNLLYSRFIFNRIKPALQEPIHIDLLFPSRTIWKLKLESCRLSSLEENVLGEGRTDDVSGALIPGIYFKYLDDRDASGIKKIVNHNSLDILSMVSLLIKICSMLESPFSGSDCEKELLGIGRMFEKNDERDATINCYEACARSDNFKVRELASRRLGDIYKKAGDYDRAVEHWNRMASGSDLSGIYPMVELAKYYEHKAKDFHKAIDIVNRAIDMVLKFGLMDTMIYRDLRKRLERLKRKAGKENA